MMEESKIKKVDDELQSNANEAEMFAMCQLADTEEVR